jgi:hypothetical protein
MATIVCVDANVGSLTRYEIGGSAVRKTHACISPVLPVTFSAKVVEGFRLMPDKEFAVEPPPRPTNPPAAAGAIQMRAAA